MCPLHFWQTFQATTVLRVHPVLFRAHKLECLLGQYTPRTPAGMRQDRMRGAQEKVVGMSSLKTSRSHILKSLHQPNKICLWANVGLQATFCNSSFTREPRINTGPGAGQIKMRSSESSSRDGQENNDEKMRIAKMYWEPSQALLYILYIQMITCISSSQHPNVRQGIFLPHFMDEDS